MRLCVILLPLLSPAVLSCGSSEPVDAAFRESVAGRFDADCQRTEAPTAEARRDLQRLCSCAGRKIRASDIAFGDGQEVVSQKVGRAADACTRELYGAAPTDGGPAR